MNETEFDFDGQEVLAVFSMVDNRDELEDCTYYLLAEKPPINVEVTSRAIIELIDEHFENNVLPAYLAERKAK